MKASESQGVDNNLDKEKIDLFKKPRWNDYT